MGYGMHAGVAGNLRENLVGHDPTPQPTLSPPSSDRRGGCRPVVGQDVVRFLRQADEIVAEISYQAHPVDHPRSVMAEQRFRRQVQQFQSLPNLAELGTYALAENAVHALRV